MRRWTPLLLVELALSLQAAHAENAARHFDQRIAPILISACLDCHSGPDPEAGLNLASRASAFAGGEGGVALRPHDPQGSMLWQRVRDGEMPPEHPLSEEDRESLRQWIADGARWGTDPIDPFRATTARRAGYDWWALQPLQEPSLPASRQAGVRNGIDRFVIARLQQSGLVPAPAAERAVLIRRLSFDLLGLPPTAEEVDAFASDSRPDAYERLVDRLLASPQYGVRWGRHWMDVARFGESQGFERDKLRENSWPYRDWVVDALNADMPYDEFARMQIAGDVLSDQVDQGVIATGFLVAGPWDEVGQNQQSAAMKAVVRQDELEDYVSVVGQSFLGLTIHCARCHDHKFDPIRQEEYYSLAAALDGVAHGSREVISQQNSQRKAELASVVAALEAERANLLAAARDRIEQAAGPAVAPAAAPIARWTFDQGLEDSIGGLHITPQGGADLQQGALRLDGRGWGSTIPLTRDLREKTLEAWIRLDDLEQRGGGAISVQTLDGGVFDAIVFGEREPRHWMAGSDGFRRTQTFGGPEETEAAASAVHMAIVYSADGTVAGYRNGKPYGTPYRTHAPPTFAAGQAQIVFGLRHAPAGSNKHLRGAIEAAQVYDRALTSEEVAVSFSAGAHGATEEELLATFSPAERQTWESLASRLAEARRARDALQPLSVYAVAPRVPGVSHLLLRGSPATPGDRVVPGGVASIQGVSSDFGLPADAPDAARRRRLAEWVTHPDNPLFARVLVNRVWHYHFGAGLVRTPSDLGFNGGQPSHPELLDWLATQFLRQGQSLKALHRLIVTSGTYRQSSRFNSRAADVDADNLLLWRMSPRRLQAEELRDAALAVAGALNTQLGGPGYRDFETFTHNTQFYEIKDMAGPRFDRRTLYRTWIRSARSPLLDVFDCPDPSTKTPQRAVTVTPLQALSLMNNAFVLRMSERFAQRLRDDAGDEVASQIQRAFRLAYGRDPQTNELGELAAFVGQHGLPELCRVILNSSEFLYID